MNENGKKRWYVIQAHAGFEHRVQKALKQLIELHGQQTWFSDILIPTESVIEMKSGKKSQSKKKFFPGYLLVQMNLTEESWDLVRKTPHVLGFVGKSNAMPTPISDREADAILNQLKISEEKPRHRFSFETGEEIRVKEGPFADFTGIVERVDYAKERLQVLISIFGRTTPIDLKFQQVSKEI